MSEATAPAWYYAQGDRQQGPVSPDALRDLIARGEVRGDTLVWRDGMAEWAMAANVPELADAFARTNRPPVAFGPVPPAGHVPQGGHPAYGGHVPYGQPHPIGYYPGGGFDPGRPARQALNRGILSIVLGLFCCPPVGIGFGVWAIVSARNVQNPPNPGTATGAVICGALGILFSILSMIGGAYIQSHGGISNFRTWRI